MANIKFLKFAERHVRPALHVEQNVSFSSHITIFIFIIHTQRIFRQPGTEVFHTFHMNTAVLPSQYTSSHATSPGYPF